jgi:hypothetical protein
MDYNYGSRHKDWRGLKKTFQTVMGTWRGDSSEDPQIPTTARPS